MTQREVRLPRVQAGGNGACGKKVPHVVFGDEFEHKSHNIDNPDTLRTKWDIA